MSHLRAAAELAATLLILAVFQWVGTSLSDILGLAIPGPVVGLLLLFCTLLMTGSPPDWFARRCTQLIGLLSLFFLPAAAGIFFLGDLMRAQWPAIFAAIVIATPLSLLATGWIMSRLMSKEPADG
jgi:holin-like protein